MPLRIGVMGGTFDPIHRGHVHVADVVARAVQLDQVIFVPVGVPWMKPAPIADAADRLAMVRLAVDGDRRFRASEVDIERSGPTYAEDTLTDLREEFAKAHPGDRAAWSFIVGADALTDFPHWHAPEQILELADLIGVTRPGHRLMAPPMPTDRLRLLEVAPMDVSSSRIRRLVAAGAPIEEFVAESVARYIADHGLYQSDPSCIGDGAA